jgi:hypothetical protein
MAALRGVKVTKSWSESEMVDVPRQETDSGMSLKYWGNKQKIGG